MHVLQLHTRYRLRGGEDAAVEAEADLLTDAGHQVTRIEAENPVAPRTSATSLAQAPWNRSWQRTVARRVAALAPDVVHVHNTWFAMTPSVIAGASVRAPVVMTLHNYRLTCVNGLLYRDGNVCEDCVGSHPWHGVAHACYRESRAQSAFAAATIAFNRKRRTWADNVAVYIALTPFAKTKFTQAGLPADRIRVKPHFTPDPGGRAAPPSASRDIVYLGRLAPEKGLDVLLAAMAAVQDTPLRLVVIGDGPQRGALERAAGSNVVFAGPLDQAAVAAVLLRARALVFPSQVYETFGLSLIEAMAAGLPVVGSDLGASADVIGADAGWVAQASDIEAWVSALRRLTSDALVDTVGSAARQAWHDRYRPQVALTALEAVYDAARSDRMAQ